MSKKTLVIGASTKPERYAYKAITELRSRGYDVEAIALKEGKVEDVEFKTEKVSFEGIDTVTLYIGPKHQQEYVDYLIELKPRRVIFNPGTENDSLEEKLKEEKIEALRACTLVLLKTNQY